MLSNRLLAGELYHATESMIDLPTVDLYELAEDELHALPQWPGIIHSHKNRHTLILHDSRLLFLRPWLQWLGYRPLTFAQCDNDVLDIFLHRLRNQSHFSSHDMIEQRAVADTMHRLLRDALHQQASDIHIEAQHESCHVRMRIDGLLKTVVTLAHAWHAPLINYCKLLAHMDIAEHRRPQDGRFSFQSGDNTCDCRLNTVPTLHGEKCVIRLLPDVSYIEHLDALGFLPEQLHTITKALEQPQGLILVTGPTGSGKTMTLYAMLQLLNTSHRNIATIEDPIEIRLAGLNQVQVNTKTKLSFASALRALLRQDPDVIMLGEIRDEETANIAIKAAQTGHLVLATLHANSTDNALSRLIDMGVSGTHLNEALSLTIAQRLARKLCTVCHGAGCSRCYNGFSGRIGLFELAPCIATIRLKDAAEYWVNKNITTMTECQRVVTC